MEEIRTEETQHSAAQTGVAERSPLPAHRILDDLSEIIAECELLLPVLAPLYSTSKRVRNIRRVACQLAQDIAAEQLR